MKNNFPIEYLITYCWNIESENIFIKYFFIKMHKIINELKGKYNLKYSLTEIRD